VSALIAEYPNVERASIGLFECIQSFQLKGVLPGELFGLLTIDEEACRLLMGPRDLVKRIIETNAKDEGAGILAPLLAVCRDFEPHELALVIHAADGPQIQRVDCRKWMEGGLA